MNELGKLEYTEKGSLGDRISHKLDKIIELLETMNYLMYSVFSNTDADPLIECPECKNKVIPNDLGYCPKCRMDLAKQIKEKYGEEDAKEMFK